MPAPGPCSVRPVQTPCRASERSAFARAWAPTAQPRVQEDSRAPSIPVAPQALTSSPYLDTRLWAYDAQQTSSSLRARPARDQPLRFTSQENPGARFRLQALDAEPAPAGGRLHKSLLTLLYHPMEPLVLSVVHTHARPPVLSVSYMG